MAALVGLVLVCGLAFGLPAHADAGVVPGEPTVLAVWGLADGDTDDAGATVRVFAGRPAARGGAARSRRALAQTNGRRADRTYRSGVSLLEFPRLPRDFVVEVSGGRAGGRRMPGSLRAVVSGYQSGDVIYVNPVTTMAAAAYRHAGAIGSRRRAYQEMRIPRWMSQADLSFSDRYFDGDTFLAAARRAGGVGALIRRLLHDHRAGRRFTGSRSARSTRAAGRLGDLSALQAQGPVPEALLNGLAGVALNLMVAGAGLAAGEVAQRNEIAVPGWLLGLFGLGTRSESSSPRSGGCSRG